MAETPANAEVEPGVRLNALRDQGADRIDPVRFAYLAALAGRLAHQPEPVRQLLGTKIQRLADELEAQAGNAMVAEGMPGELGAKSPLAGLLEYIRAQALVSPRDSQSYPPASPAALLPSGEPGDTRAPELKSVAYFRDTWSKLSTEQRLTQTLAQAPENAGPLNSQHLVLRALKAMHACSPDYLQAFMSYADTLIWLEQASPLRPKAESPRPEKGKTTRRSAGKR